MGSSGGGKGPKPRAGFYWAEAEDTIGGVTSRDLTLSRWATALQNDFKARMQWSVTPDFGKANHEPRLVVQQDRTQQVLRVTAPAGKPYELSAAGTDDPDGDKLGYNWFIYPEPGTYRGGMPVIARADQQQAVLPVPDDAAGRTIHVILEVTDSGTPALTRHRRIVLTAE